ncbi:MAG: hypothetical protein ACI8PD_002261, partial [Nitrospinales bacterium]
PNLNCFTTFKGFNELYLVKVHPSRLKASFEEASPVEVTILSIMGGKETIP